MDLATINPSNSAGNYTPTTLSTSDMYTNNKLQGYYLISPTFSETFDHPDASLSVYTITLTQKWYNTDGTSVLSSKSASQQFYYDALTGNPAIDSSSSSSYYTNTSATTNVSGISVIGATATFNLSINVTNLYNFFYVSPVLNYQFGEGCITNTNVLNLSNYNNPTANTFTLGANASVSNAFKNTQTLNVTANNLNGSTSSNITTSKDAIYDKPSYTFITNTTTNPTSIQEINAFGSTIFGCRVWSNVDTTSVNPVGYAVIPPPYKYTNNNYSYSQFPYNQSWSIINETTNITTPTFNGAINTSQEIQIYNGHYGTGSTTDTTSGTNGYIDYTTYYSNSNSLNYNVLRTNISYRYTTFVWKIIPPSGPTNYYQFTFNNISATSISGTSPPFTLNNNQRFFLFYKTEQIETGNDNTSSLWIYCNSTYGTANNNEVASIDIDIEALTILNYNTPYNNTIIRAPASTGYTINNRNLIANVSAIPFNGTAKTHYIYCRFGNSMNYTITYESVTLSLLSQ